MYSLQKISYLYLFMGSISLLVYFNIPEKINSPFLSQWILILSIIYFVLGLVRLIRHIRNR